MRGGRPRRQRPQKLAQLRFQRYLIPPPDEWSPGARLSLLPLDAQPAPEGGETDQGFLEVRRRVSAAKSQLDGLPDFEALMRALDLCRGLKRRAAGEFGLQVATNASLKMYELIVQARLLVCADGALPRLRVFCNAELPGAFLAAINHYTRTMCPRTGLEWLGSSYLPAAAAEAAGGDTTILGDQYGLYAANRERWLMGPAPNGMPEGALAVSGDVTDPEVVDALSAAVHARFAAAGEAEAKEAGGGLPSGAMLYTSDAGIDVSDDYNRQEELTSLLNFGQVVAGVLSLAPGGHLVTKQYTFTARFSRSLIALLAALFEEVWVTKPVTSRPANSEVYLVAKGFRGVADELADELLDRLAAYRALPAGATPCERPPLLDPESFAAADAAMLRAARQIHEGQQVEFLNEAFAHRGRGRDLDRELAGPARAAQEAWLLANPMRRIEPRFQLPGKTS